MTTAKHFFPEISKMSGDEIVLNFYDACIYRRDLWLLTNKTSWLNDSCIHFYMKFLQKTKLKPSDGFQTLFMDPSVISFLMHQCTDDEDMKDFAQGCTGFQGVTCLVIPINDNMHEAANWTQPGAGTHWSLLLLSWSSDTAADPRLCLHLDSVRGSGNFQTARQVASKICSSRALVRAHAPTSSMQLEEADVPLQQNGYDCGVHVLASAEAIASLSTGLTKGSVENAVSKELELEKNKLFCFEFRKKMVNTIKELQSKFQSRI